MPFTRRQFTLTTTAALAGATAACTSTKRPNILLLLADDQSFPHAAAYHPGIPIQTPAFDRIAREGALFTRAYTSCPSCTPSRSAILAGRPFWQLGQAGLLYGAFPPEVKTFPHLLAEAGYHTGFTGKSWLPGDWRALGLTQHPCGREYNQHKLNPAPHEALDQRDAAANFRAFLRDRPSGAPFCFWFGSTEPHRAYERGAGLRAGKRLEDARVPGFLPDTPAVRSDLLDYYNEIEIFDRHCANILKALEETDELDNTLVIVTSDNGMPFPRAKVNLYEPGVHMPLAIRWGARSRPGMNLDEFVSHTDLAPTILDAAGIPKPPEMTGSSLVPLLEGKRDATRDQAFFGVERHVMARPNGLGYPMRGLRAERYLYIRNFEPDRWPTGGDFLSSNRTPHGDVDAAPTLDELLKNPTSPQAGLGLGKRPAEELYQVEQDPDNIHNLAADPSHQNIMEKMRARLSAYLRFTKDPRIEGLDPWSQYPYRQTQGFGSSFNSTLPAEVREAARALPRQKPQ